MAKKSSAAKKGVRDQGKNISGSILNNTDQHDTPYTKYMFLMFFLGLLVLAFLVVRPYISTLIVATVIVYVFYPLYKKLAQATGKPRVSSVIMIILLLLVLSVPLAFVSAKMTKESYDIYLGVKRALLKADSLEDSCNTNSSGVICNFYVSAMQVSDKYDLNLAFHLARILSNAATYFVSKASDIIINIPNLLLHIFIAMFTMYYLFVHGKEWARSLHWTLPLSERDSRRIFQQFNDIIYATIFGAVVIAIVQAIIATIGYFIFGVSSPILLGIFTLIAAFIPFLGAALVWLPVCLVMFANGIISDSGSIILRASGLLLWGVLVSTIDNVIRPKLVGSRAHVHPLVILLGVFGGLAFFGFAGIMIGPLLLTLFIASLKIYRQEKENFT